MIQFLLRSFIATLASLVFITHSFAEDTEANLILMPAKPDAGFEYPYFLKIPKKLADQDKLFLIVSPNNSGVHDDYNIHLANTRAEALGQGPSALVANNLKLPLLVPVFPRTQAQHLIYTHALDSDSIKIKSGKSARLDIQLLRMVEDARQHLGSQAIVVEEKFVLVGFSASGTFSNRFAFLHPSSLLAVVSGAVNSFPMLPVADLEGTPLNYPLGISDIKAITGADFDLNSWLALAQLIFMGAKDDNDAVGFSDGYSNQERKLVYKLVGKEMAPRWSKAQSIYLDKNPNATLVTYGQVGHWTNGRIHRDIINFVDSAIQKDIFNSAK